MDIAVLQADALAVAADVLVLKHAQGLYGVDALVVQRLDSHAAGVFPRVPLPPPGSASLVDSRGLLGAAALLFIGVERLGDFGYAEIRAFARRTLEDLADRLPGTSSVAMTVHGVGFGLDETEAFRAQLAGLLEALQRGRFPPALRRIAIVEHNPGRAQRLQRELAITFPGGAIDVPRLQGRADQTLPTAALRTAGAPSRDKPHVFVAMPFAKEFDDRFHYGIEAAIRSAGYLCERADMASFTGDVIAWVKQRIDSARLLVADLSGANANVYLEIGYAWGRGVPTVLLAGDQKELLFDVRGQRCLVYDSIRSLETQLTRELQQLRTAAP